MDGCYGANVVFGVAMVEDAMHQAKHGESMEERGVLPFVTSDASVSGGQRIPTWNFVDTRSCEIQRMGESPPLNLNLTTDRFC